MRAQARPGRRRPPGSRGGSSPATSRPTSLGLEPAIALQADHLGEDHGPHRRRGDRPPAQAGRRRVGQEGRPRLDRRLDVLGRRRARAIARSRPRLCVDRPAAARRPRSPRRGRPARSERRELEVRVRIDETRARSPRCRGPGRTVARSAEPTQAIRPCSIVRQPSSIGGPSTGKTYRAWMVSVPRLIGRLPGQSPDGEAESGSSLGRFRLGSSDRARIRHAGSTGSSAARRPAGRSARTSTSTKRTASTPERSTLATIQCP